MSIHGTFVSEKINKIRWRPDEMNNSNFFMTGSWDNDENTLKLWNFQESEEDGEVYPFAVAERPHLGDITELKFLDQDYFVTSSSVGCVQLMKITGVNPSIESKITWDLHKFPNGEVSPCTFALYDNDIASVGEDGRINLLNSQGKSIYRRIDNADSCSIQCVIFIKHSELLTSNLRGHMKVWDIRCPSDEPASSFMLSGEQITPTCLQFHPTQRHLVMAGDEEGTVTVWDLRYNTFPVNSLEAHDGSISEIHFHPDHPDNLFTCSDDGDVWQWSTKAGAIGLQSVEGNVWLAPDAIKNKMDVMRLMPKLHKPINSLDLNRNKVLCGCDNEAIYLISGVTI